MPSRPCWCGHDRLEEYSADYRVCRACGTLVTTAAVADDSLAVTRDSGELYSRDYWFTRQQERYGLPPIDERARLDLPERCVHWLNLLLRRRLPPARTLEIGCAHGGFVALMESAGYDASGTEMSPAVVQFARDTFGVRVEAGRIENLDIAPVDVVILNDVLEHLPDPVGTMGRCVSLLKPGGFIIIQTPEYKEHLAHADLERTSDRFLEHMRGKNEEHLYLFSRRSASLLFERVGLPMVAFENPIFDYDLYFTASREPLPENSPETIAAALSRRPAGRLVLALLDKARESLDRWWAIQRLESGGKRH